MSDKLISLATAILKRHNFQVENVGLMENLFLLRDTSTRRRSGEARAKHKGDQDHINL